MWQAARESVMESRAEHDDKLNIAMGQPTCLRVNEARHKHAREARFQIILSATEKLTAILGLSASTYSCGGDGSRFGGGVSDSFLKYFAMPTGVSSTAIASSSVGGADDNDDRSESERVMLKLVVGKVGRWCEGQS